MQHKILQLHPQDNLIAALQPLKKGETYRVNGHDITLATDIAAKHKFAASDLQPGDPAYMYGVLVGKATQFIPAGGWIHSDNLEHAAARYEAAADTASTAQPTWQAPDTSRFEGRSWQGYHRADGSVGSANYWLVVPLVFCENRNIEVLREAMLEPLGYAVKKDFLVDVPALVEAWQKGADAETLLQLNIEKSRAITPDKRPFPHVDGIKFLTHTSGCGCTRQDGNALCDLLAGYITSPNVAGATVLSLGCQHSQTALLEQAIRARDPHFDKPLFVLEQQKSSSERALIAEAVKKTFVGLTLANNARRAPAPLSQLTLGLKCGGSDGFSGLSANPALGYASDLLVALGGKSLLPEFPELNGVEQELIDRCVSPDLGKKFAHLMKSYSDVAEAIGSGFKNNPSPGNIKDGLITDAIKSAGAARKGGTAPVEDVLDYAEKPLKPGLALLCTPGNDVEATTALAGSGANVIVFTTGLGTPTGNPIVPVIKFSTNTELARRMGDLIDIDAGDIITGEKTIAQKGEELLEYVIAVASGEATPHAVRLGQDDFIPWKRGVSL